MIEIKKLIKDLKEASREFPSSGKEYPWVGRYFTKAFCAIEAQEARIQELEDALAFYAFEDNYQERVVTRSCGCCSDFLDSAAKEDGGDLARRALSHINTNEAEK